MEGAEALPRLNGELVFEEPWEGRAFGIAVALNNHRLYEWHEFREHLVGQISSDEKAGTEAHYYDQWLRAMEGLLLQQGLVTSEELERRTEEYASGQREDHEHGPDDDHGHGEHHH
jgi:nitrile hydratase accessory protein